MSIRQKLFLPTQAYQQDVQRVEKNRNLKVIDLSEHCVYVSRKFHTFTPSEMKLLRVECRMISICLQPFNAG